MRFIRVLYGESIGEHRPKLLRDLRRAFSAKRHGQRIREFLQREVVYYTMGSDATELLQQFDVKKIRQVCHAPLIKEKCGGVLSWNKMFLIRAALEEHPDGVLYTDHDIAIASDFNKRSVVRQLRNHDGLGRVFQMPLISYHKPYFWFRPHNKKKGWDLITPRIGFFGCLMYVASLKLIDCFFADHDEMVAKFKRKAGDEQFITYSLDKRLGPLTLGEMFDNFMPATLIRPRCPFVIRAGVEKLPNPTFQHKR